jgi:phosphoserine phosphatase RsbU/P
MLLRTRIIVFVMLVVTGVAGLVFAVGALRERDKTARIAELEITKVEQAWAFAVAGAADGISLRLANAAADPRLMAAVEAGDEAALSALAGAMQDQGFVWVNVFSANGDLLFGGADALNPLPLLGASRVVEALRDDHPAGGARVLDGQQLGVVGSAPVGVVAGRAVGLLAAALPLNRAFDTMARLTGAGVYGVDRDGRLAYGPDDALWKAARLATAGGMIQRGLTVFDNDDRGRHYEVAVLPAADVMGGRLATLYVVRDITQAIESQRLWDKVSAGGVVVAFLAAMLMLYLYLRHHFETLGDAVSALHDLARGSRGGYVELPAGNDEIGRIAQAVGVFGQAVREVERASVQRERRQRRQQRFIRRQMEQLAATLEEESRRELLSELAQMEAAAGDPQSAQSKGVGDELGLIALGFSRLATKVSVQQVQLSQLVRDLREALEDKRKLISLQQELEIAANMQLSILPREFPDLPQLDIAASMDPAKEVGGDFYDVFELGDNRLGVAIADVSGKGIPAAFFMLISRTMLRTVAAEGQGPALTLSRLNNLLSAENEQMMFVTLFYAEIDLASGLVTYCSGGHNPPVLTRAGGGVTMVAQTAGIALATFPDLPYSQMTLTLEPGDTLFLYTDGVSEAFAPDETMFGDDRLLATLALAVPASAEEALVRVMQAVSSFTTGAEQSDDITGLAVHWRG